MSEYDSTASTLEHKKTVTKYINLIIHELINRAEKHDDTKLEEPEKSLFDTYTPKLAECEYNSEEYKSFLEGLKPALDHHYARSRHHPEYEEYNLLEWRDIKGYEGVYSVSNYGDIKNLITDKKLKSYITPKGYLRLQLQYQGIPKNYLVHKLVAEHFIENPDNKPQVNHKDCNKQNNYVGNLEWVTNGENQIHAYETGLQEIKYIVHCIEHNITTFGCTAMERELKKLGYTKARESGVLACINDKASHHMNLHFDGYLLKDYQRSSLSNMNIIDLVEMLCDWKAASLRQHNGNILKSIEQNAERFGYGKEISSVFINTIDFFEE